MRIPVPPHHAARRIAAATAAIIAAMPFLRILFLSLSGSDIYLNGMEDDFFYYAIIANNIVHAGHSTFDGITSTNGYHPLWMGLLMLLAWLFGGIGAGFMTALAALQGMLAYLFFAVARRLAEELHGRVWYAPAAALLVTALTIRSFWSGMEEALAIPLYVYVLLEIARIEAPERVDAWRMARLGLTASTLVLARLDAALLVLLAATAWMIAGDVPFRRRAAMLGAAALGAWPLALYLLWNLLAFGSFLPISGAAKQLAPGLALSSHMLLPVITRPSLLLTCGLAVVGIVLDRRARRAGKSISPGRPSHRIAILLAIVFPPLFLVMHGLLSDWMLWPWYNYWQPAVRLLLLLWLCRSVLRLAGTAAKKLAGPALAAAALAAMALTATHLVDHRQIDPDWTYVHGKRLAAFARTHPGRYAMGDRAGLTAYFLGQPLVQLEGIVGDRALVERIRRRAPLEEVLAGYHVDYLIVSSWHPLPRDGDRLVVTIPDALQAGTRSPSMTGRFDQPVLAFTNDGRCYSYVFAVSARSRTAARRSSMGAKREMDSGFPDWSVPER